MTRLLTAIALVLSMMLTLTASAADTSGPQVGKPAPTFDLKDVNGKEHKLADYAGKIVVIQFQSATCPWERAYQPILNGVSDKYKDKGVVFVGINSNSSETVEKIKAKADDEKVPYDTLKDPGNKIADAYDAQTTPHIFIIDGKGVLRYKGGVEKAPSDPSGAGKASEQYLVPALDSIVAGKDPAQASTKSVGCSIKRVKQ
jgi:peroxiredoxin